MKRKELSAARGGEKNTAGGAVSVLPLLVPKRGKIMRIIGIGVVSHTRNGVISVLSSLRHKHTAGIGYFSSRERDAFQP